MRNDDNFSTLKWGLNDYLITCKIKSLVTKVAYCRVSYDYGLKYKFEFTQLPVWKKKIDSTIEGNTFWVQIRVHSLLLIREVKNMLTT